MPRHNGTMASPSMSRVAVASYGAHDIVSQYVPLKNTAVLDSVGYFEFRNIANFARFAACGL